jgi:hypothetical protein
MITFNTNVDSITQMMLEMVQTFSTEAPKRVVKTRRELYKAVFEIRLTKKRLMRNYRAIMGHSMSQEKRSADRRRRPSPC